MSFWFYILPPACLAFGYICGKRETKEIVTHSFLTGYEMALQQVKDELLKGNLDETR